MPNREYLLELHSDRTAIKTKERVDYMKNRFICAEEVAQELSVSKQKSLIFSEKPLDTSKYA